MCERSPRPSRSSERRRRVRVVAAPPLSELSRPWLRLGDGERRKRGASSGGVPHDRSRLCDVRARSSEDCDMGLPRVRSRLGDRCRDSSADAVDDMPELELVPRAL